jgi:hypothetical protein
LRENTQIFTQDECRELYARIKNVRLGCSFLVFGFDKCQKAHIFEVSEGASGDVSDKVMDEVGFWAIGSGQYSALSILFFHEYNASREIPIAVYRVCEAKFMAESAQGVGKYTVITLFRPDLQACFLGQAQINPIREKWRLEGAPRTPQDAKNLVESMVNWVSLEEWKGNTVVENSGGESEPQIGASDIATATPQEMRKIMLENSQALEMVITNIVGD